MQIRSWFLIGSLWVGSASLAQQAPEPEGFFRPATDPAINRPPVAPSASSARSRGSSVPAPEAASVAAPMQPLEPTGRELERVEREHEQARLESMRQPPPAIVSPLDGSAPITSPLDGSARIISPLGR